MSLADSPGRSCRAGSAMPTSSPAPAAWAKRAPPGSSPRRWNAWRDRPPSRATPATPALRCRPDRMWMWSRSMPPAIAASMRSASCGKTSPCVRRGAATRSTSSTKSTCSRGRPSTRCSKRWRNRRRMSNLCSAPPSRKNSRSPSSPAASGLILSPSMPLPLPGGWSRSWPPRGRPSALKRWP